MTQPTDPLAGFPELQDERQHKQELLAALPEVLRTLVEELRFRADAFFNGSRDEQADAILALARERLYWHEEAMSAELQRDRLERDLQRAREELAALRDWQQTITNAPGEARSIGIERMRDSMELEPIVSAWKQQLARSEALVTKVAEGVRNECAESLTGGYSFAARIVRAINVPALIARIRAAGEEL